MQQFQFLHRCVCLPAPVLATTLSFEQVVLRKQMRKREDDETVRNTTSRLQINGHATATSAARLTVLDQVKVEVLHACLIPVHRPIKVVLLVLLRRILHFKPLTMPTLRATKYFLLALPSASHRFLCLTSESSVVQCPPSPSLCV
jgi:hypothetical protein